MTRRLPSDAVLLVAAGLLAVLPILAVFYRPDGTTGLDVTGHPIGRDFINMWVGPRLAFSGRLATLFDLDAYHAAIGIEFGQALPFHNWGYPPFTLLLLRPLGGLPYVAALALWTAGLFAAFAGVTLSQVPPERRRAALLALALAPACLINAAGGQNGFLTAALLIGGLLALDRRPVLAGILFGLLTWKPHLGLVLPPVLIVLGAWRTIAAAVATTLLLVAASVLVLGLSPWQHFLTETSAYQYALLQQFRGFYPVMMASAFVDARNLGLPMGAAWGLQLAVGLPVLAAAIWAAHRARDPVRRAGVIATAAPLLTPYAFNYDLTGVAAVLVWRLFAAPPRTAPIVVTALAWTAPALLMLVRFAGGGGAWLVVLALFAVLVREVAAEAPARSGAGGLAAAE
ncbi:glycosyltransferase family 87 protein [Methylobacterium nonmethylotrophicum]|uniref:DUF2029 domain-containing protein n=1 Tax=Methylobacterium nonmethylotrophicum TaxID=1141884 RepID=A0A4Z0NXE6_9HYPH|nr:glycosyltransferase family 87 protein [Methylobacterium nonmethylotrophicum]TGE02327.1 DUF2029 domain-containing protein [Methylobacterium nonmethylotrophicum]